MAHGARLKLAVDRAVDILRAWGIEDRPTVKARTLSDDHWLAQYRSRSQFRGRPIFWVNVDAHPDDASLVTSLLHEYGHVIYEWAEVRDQPLLEDIDAISADEEDFAETVALVMQNPKRSTTYAAIIFRFAQVIR